MAHFDPEHWLTFTGIIILMVAGGGSIIGGLILKNIGNRKMNEYQIKLNGLKTSGYITPNSIGVRLAYTF